MRTTAIAPCAGLILNGRRYCSSSQGAGVGPRGAWCVRGQCRCRCKGSQTWTGWTRPGAGFDQTEVTTTRTLDFWGGYVPLSPSCFLSFLLVWLEDWLEEGTYLLPLSLTLTLTSLTLQYRLSSFSLSVCLSVAEALPSRSGRSICDAICMNWSMAPPHTDNLTCPSDCMSVCLSVGLHGNRRFGPPKYLLGHVHSSSGLLRFIAATTTAWQARQGKASRQSCEGSRDQVQYLHTCMQMVHTHDHG